MRKHFDRLCRWVFGVARSRPSRRQPLRLEFDALERRDVPSVTFQDVAHGFTDSTEFRQEFVEDAYVRYLNRKPSQAEVNSWVGNFHNGDDHQEANDELNILSGIAGSQENFNTHGGTAQSWVAGLYSNVLGRTGSTAEIQGWLNSGNVGGPSTGVARAFLTSQESRTNLVNDLYAGLLQRPGETGGVNFWSNQLGNGTSYADVIAGFVASPEYVAAHGNTAAGFLTGVYGDVLGRLPDQPGFTGWGRQLDPNFNAQAPTTGTPSAVVELILEGEFSG